MLKHLLGMGLACALVAIGWALRPAVAAQEPKAPASRPATAGSGSGKVELKRWSREAELWVDRKHKLVVINGEVCLREGLLEMFACPKGTKEHESIVSVNCRAQDVHAALLVVGAKPGRPVRFQPTYQPATGDRIEVLVLWRDQQGKPHKTRAQQWIKNVKTGKAMTHPWVFAGSGFWTDPDTGKQYYQGDGGDFICVSNFPSATLDLPIKSSQSNEELMFTAFTERIPPVGTKVRLVLYPKPSKAGGQPTQPKGKPEEPRPGSQQQ